MYPAHSIECDEAASWEGLIDSKNERVLSVNDFERDGTKAFFDHYLALSRSGVPHRNALIPFDIPRLLPHVIIGRYVDEDTLYYRLVGTHVVTMFGSDPTGRNLFDIQPPEIATNWRNYFKQSRESPAWAYALGRMNTEYGSIYEVENAVFPFLDDDGQMTFFIGYCEYLELRAFGPKKGRGVKQTQWKVTPLEGL